MPEKLLPIERHESMRGWFAYYLHEHMCRDEKIWVVSGDLGYGMFDKIRRDFPDRFINTGAAEQSMMGISVGLALEGKIPIVYSITPFLLLRPFETISLYVNGEGIPVKLIGAGRNRDYLHDGPSHWMDNDRQLMQLFPNINSCWPDTKEEIPLVIDQMLEINRPWYINLKR